METAVESSNKPVRLDIVLSEPTGQMPAALLEASPAHAAAPPPLSAEEIQKKLEAAEERRQSLLLEKRASIGARLSKVEEVQQRKQELAAQQPKENGDGEGCAGEKVEQ
jgi:hypothetical protein